MARIVLAQGTSHSPQLSIDTTEWGVFAEFDEHVNLLQDRDGVRRAFADLVAAHGDRHTAAIETAEWVRRKAACDAGIATLRELMAAADPDCVIVIGDDQDELFHTDNLPALLVYRGTTSAATGVGSPDKIARVTGNPVRAMSEWAYSPDTDIEYPVAGALADHLVASLMAAGFDLAQSTRTPGDRGVGHGFGFPFQRVFDTVRPVVPVMINTYYPPNQPTPARCVQLGVTLRQAIETYADDSVRVAIVASGGLSHHLIDEELDQTVLAAIASGDLDTLAALPVSALDGGTSEVRNWIAMAPSVIGLEHQTTVYEPCYRTLAGTGCGMAFASWAA